MVRKLAFLTEGQEFKPYCFRLFSRALLQGGSDSITTNVCLSVCLSLGQHLTFFAYKSRTDGWILMILTYIIDIDETVKLTQGQGHKVKGQGQICIYVKFLFRL